MPRKNVPGALEFASGVMYGLHLSGCSREPQYITKINQGGSSMKKWRCVICDYIHEGPEAPEVCPECGAGSDSFEEVV